MARRLDSEGWHGDSPPEAGLLESRRASPEAHGSGSDSPASVGVLRERLGVAGPLHDSAFPGLLHVGLPPAHGSPPAAHRTQAGLNPSPRTGSWKVGSLSACPQSPTAERHLQLPTLAASASHLPRGEPSRVAGPWPRRVGHPDEVRATHQTTAVDLPLLLTVASSAFTGGSSQS